MDPVTAVGLALSVAGLAGQVFKGCIQGMHLIITAKNLPEDSKYLNLRLRMEQQRLFAWSETSGLLDLDGSNEEKIRNSNTFMIHRTTILDLLVQIKCLFEEFEKAQRKNGHLKISSEPVASNDEFVGDPGKDSSSAYVPLPERRKNYIVKAMQAMKSKTSDPLREGRRRLAWAAFQKDEFEAMLQRFSALNDNMTDILDARLQVEIHRTTEDTNRGVLQLHKNIASLHQLVMALNIKMQAHAYPIAVAQEYTPDNAASGLLLLAQLAKFKAFNEYIDTGKDSTSWNKDMASILEFSKGDAETRKIKINRSSIQLTQESLSNIRCEGILDRDGKKEKVWIEWKEYDYESKQTVSPPHLIIDRVQKLAALLHHTPKPEAFRVPHCLGYFDDANAKSGSESGSEGEDEGEPRIGFVFERPKGENISSDSPPMSLFELLSTSTKPRITDRIHLAHAIANCLLHLHSVNWLHKGLRSQNIVFFPRQSLSSTSRIPGIDYRKPYLSGFDFARPARANEMTEIPGDVPEYNMYRHPNTQGSGFGPRESFRKSFDIYSLGVVLVELAHWKTIDRVLENKVKNTRAIRETLLEERRIAEVGANMGEVYENATRKCIAGGLELGIEETDDETSDTVAAKLSFHFYEEVVKRLGDVKV